MDENQKNKLIRFLNDKITSDAVYDILLRSFLKVPKDRAVENLAASMIAVERLDDAWKELAKLKGEQKAQGEDKLQRGL
jgi:flagellin-specific chaperone FliS